MVGRSKLQRPYETIYMLEIVVNFALKQPISGGKAVITGASIPCPEGRLFIELTSDEQSLLYLKWFGKFLFSCTSPYWYDSNCKGAFLELTTPRNGITLEMSNS